MAEIPWITVPDAVIDGYVVAASGLGSGDVTGEFTINEGNSDVSVGVFGTAGGSTINITGALGTNDFGTIDDAFGVELSFTTVGRIKPIGPGVQKIKGSVVGGSGVNVKIVLYIVKGRR